MEAMTEIVGSGKIYQSPMEKTDKISIKELSEILEGDRQIAASKNLDLETYFDGDKRSIVWVLTDAAL